MEYVRAERKDSPEIIGLVREVWKEYDCILNIWIVREKGILVATAGLSIEEDTAEMKTLYVRKDARGRGLGTKLTNLALETAKERGAKSIELWSDTRFVDAHRMYERLGFVRFGERDLFDHNNTREYGYRRHI